ncbi:MAG: DUF106 domain-containing protein [Candidatus Aenigmatarchaeota archaeon]|nr:MAG: DUF106 domain-containing protein [Candidatus Aenigmarchaeota archaeon]
MEFLVTHAALSIAVVALVTSFAITLIYKYTMDQNKAKNIRLELEELKKKAVDAQKENNQKDSKKYQDRMMEISHDQMRMSMKPMMVTFVIVIPVFVWLLPLLYAVPSVTLTEGSGTLVYQGVDIPVTLTTNSDPVLTIGAVPVNGETYGKEVKFPNTVVVNEGGYMFQPVLYNKETSRLEAKRIVVTLPVPLPFFGSELGWIGWYVFCSLPLGILTRKLMGVV